MNFVRNFCKDIMKRPLQIGLLLGIFCRICRSNVTLCDKEFIYDENYGYGFAIYCKNIQQGQEQLIQHVSVSNAVLLNISDSVLLNVTAGMFENIPKIRELNIENSVLHFNQDEAVFSKLENLQSAIFRNTTFKNIGPSTFKYLDKLKILQLENNNINNISARILQMSQLEQLVFINNNLIDVNDIPLCELPNIKSINLAMNKITVLLPNSFSCEKLEGNNSQNVLIFNLVDINLSYNNISSLGNAFNNLSQVKYLTLDSNMITNISAEVFKSMRSLKKINLKNNSINHLDRKAFQNFESLKEIDLSSNKLSKLFLEDLISLTYLNLKNNLLNFKKLQIINNLPILERLILSNNKLNGATNDLFNNFSLLTHLELNHNEILLDDTSFWRLGRLEELHLSYNKIKRLPDLVFQKLEFLTVLDLSGNNLNEIDHNETFSNLVNLVSLNLSYNQLDTLRYDLFNELDNLNVLDIAGNKLKYLDYKLTISNMRSLDVINIKDNLMSCSFLLELTNFFKNNGISYTVDEKYVYDKENVAGVYCREYNVTSVMSNVVTVNSLTIFAVTSVFILLIMIIVVLSHKYYYYVKRRAYLIDELELIED